MNASTSKNSKPKLHHIFGKMFRFICRLCVRSNGTLLGWQQRKNTCFIDQWSCEWTNGKSSTEYDPSGDFKAHVVPYRRTHFVGCLFIEKKKTLWYKYGINIRHVVVASAPVNHIKPDKKWMENPDTANTEVLCQFFSFNWSFGRRYTVHTHPQINTKTHDGNDFGLPTNVHCAWCTSEMDFQNFFSVSLSHECRTKAKNTLLDITS